MTIDEKIAHEKRLAVGYRNDIQIMKNMGADISSIISLTKKAEYHEQLAEQLEELKLPKEEKKEFQIIARDNYEIGYEKAIDDFVNACKEDILCQTFGLHQNGIEKIAKQLKEGVK